ncbi:MAG: hypothetical protein HXY45_01425 [Syntrophaceae bacterium]|nr:hypothetical protein [Syntrophaceae bacterium]
MKTFLIASAAFLGSLLVGLTFLSVFPSRNSPADEVIKAAVPLTHREGFSPMRKEAFRPLFSKTSEGDHSNDSPLERKKKDPPPGYSLPKEKSGNKTPPGALSPILASAGIPMKEIPPQRKEEMESFLEKLGEISQRRDTDDGNGQAQEIFFSTLIPDLKTGVFAPMERFSPGTIRVFGAFATDRELFQDLDHVLVKWFNPQSRADMFQYLPITPNANYNYIWRELPYWEPGIYNVEVYRVGLGADVKVLASGSFYVEDLEDYLSYAALYRDLNQTLSQTDFLQGEPIYLKLNHSAHKHQKLTLSVRDRNNGPILSSREIHLSATMSSSSFLVKGPSDFPGKGLFWLELAAEDGLLIGRTKFGIQ